MRPIGVDKGGEGIQNHPAKTLSRCRSESKVEVPQINHTWSPRWREEPHASQEADLQPEEREGEGDPWCSCYFAHQALLQNGL